MKFEFSGLIAGKYSDIILVFHGNPSAGSHVVPYVGRTDRCDEANSCSFATFQTRLKRN